MENWAVMFGVKSLRCNQPNIKSPLLIFGKQFKRQFDEYEFYFRKNFSKVTQMYHFLPGI